MPAIRSDSLWRSSPAPRMRGRAARRGRRRGRGSGSRRSRRRRRAGPRSIGVERARADARSAIGSPPSTAGPSAPLGRASLDVGAHRPQEVDDRPPGRVDADAAERQLGVRVDRARDEPERGRRDVARDPLVDRQHRRPSFETDRHRHRPADRRRDGLDARRPAPGASAPCGRASRPTRGPSSGRPPGAPARRIADLTWALGTGVETSTARSGLRPITVTGGRESFDRAWSAAPIERSGSMIRATGRRRNESSPSRTLRKGRPARIPANSRRLVPELPQSRSAAGSRSPSTPGDDDAVVDGVARSRRRRSARRPRPSARADRRRRADVRAVARALDPALAGGQRREHQRPMADRLVAGQRAARRAGGPRGGRRRTGPR